VRCRAGVLDLCHDNVSLAWGLENQGHITFVLTPSTFVSAHAVLVIVEVVFNDAGETTLRRFHYSSGANSKKNFVSDGHSLSCQMLTLCLFPPLT